MSLSLHVQGFAGKESKDFQKHFRAVKFCIEHDLSFPIETSEFFKNKVEGGSLEDFHRGYLLEKIRNGIEIPLITTGDEFQVIIKVAEIPKEVDTLIVRLS